jgi:hypothetical protein
MNTPLSGYEHIFTTMVETQQNRSMFIQETLDFLDKYGFDG